MLVKQVSVGQVICNMLGQQLLVVLECVDVECGDCVDDVLLCVLMEVLLVCQQQLEGVLFVVLVEWVKQWVVVVDVVVIDVYVCQVMISSVVYVLCQVGDDVGVEVLLLVELKCSEQLYYYMFELVELVEQCGDIVGVLVWLKCVYDGVQGLVICVQWGVLYVEGLLKLVLDDVLCIEQVIVLLIVELEVQFLGYYQCICQCFECLVGQLKVWSGKYQGVEILVWLQQWMQQVCGEQVDGVCKDWLS